MFDFFTGIQLAVLGLGNGFTFITPEPGEMDPVMDQVNGYLFIKGYVHGVSGIEVPVTQILT